MELLFCRHKRVVLLEKKHIMSCSAKRCDPQGELEPPTGTTLAAGTSTLTKVAKSLLGGSDAACGRRRKGVRGVELEACSNVGGQFPGTQHVCIRRRLTLPGRLPRLPKIRTMIVMQFVCRQTDGK